MGKGYELTFQERLISEARREKRLAKKHKKQRRKQGRGDVKKEPSQYRGPYIDPNSPEFLTSYQWRSLRMDALVKYGAQCMCCGATPAHGAVMNVDHIKPRRLRPDLALDINNLQILCGVCNHGKGNRHETDWRPAAREEGADRIEEEFSLARVREMLGQF